jgi:hypothetical protein
VPGDGFLIIGGGLISLYLVIIWLDRRSWRRDHGAEIDEYLYQIDKLNVELAQETERREVAERALEESRRQLTHFRQPANTDSRPRSVCVNECHGNYSSGANRSDGTSPARPIAPAPRARANDFHQN